MKPAIKKERVWTAENGVDDGVTVDGHGRVRGGGQCSAPLSSAEGAAGGRLERKKKSKMEKEKYRILEVGTEVVPSLYRR